MIGGFDLLALLSAPMPKLRHVKLEAIELTDWFWEGVFEGLCLFKNLQDLNLPFEPELLRHREGEAYPKQEPGTSWGNYKKHVIDFRRDIEDYVINGGRHPSLLVNTCK